MPQGFLWRTSGILREEKLTEFPPSNEKNDGDQYLSKDPEMSSVSTAPNKLELVQHEVYVGWHAYERLHRVT